MSKILFACALDRLWFQVEMPLWKTSSAKNNVVEFYPDLTSPDDKDWKRLAPKAVPLLKPILEMLPGDSSFVYLSVQKDSFSIHTDESTIRQAYLFPKAMKHVCKTVGTNNVVVFDRWRSTKLVERARKYVNSGW